MPRTTDIPYDERPFGEGEGEDEISTYPEPEAPMPETDTGTTTLTVDSERKVTWGYTRKKNLGNDAHGNPRYESEEVSLYVTDMVPEGEQIMSWVANQSPLAYDVIKAEVWSALDLDFGYDEGGVPYLVPPTIGTRGLPPPVAPPTNFDPSEAVGPVQKGSPVGPSTRPTPPGGANDPSMAQVGYYAAPPVFCKSCGSKDFYDNRAEGDTKVSNRQKLGPDWKCKGCGKGVFRPGSFDYNKLVG